MILRQKLHGVILSTQRCIFTSIYRNLSLGCREIREREITQDAKKSIENHWKEVVSRGEFNEEAPGEKHYVLSMFPYPSGNLHMGHVRVYTISDAMARFFRMCGKNVLHPMGWDAFGLPAENAARQRGIPANQWTESNIRNMKQQLQRLGCSFDWRREVATCHPGYYKWTQYLFVRLFRERLAYQREALVNWDSVDETVLANEQVDANGCSWRSGAKVEKRLLKQWFIRTTRFSKELLEGLDNPILEDWKDIVNLQKHWIGECDGYSFDFPILSCLPGQKPPISVLSIWIERPEMIKISSFVGVSPSHPLAAHCSNLVAVNPFTGQKIPLLVAEDSHFQPGCDVFLGIPTIREADKQLAHNAGIEIHTKSIPKASEAEEVIREARKLGIGGFPVSSKLKDWAISRQRLWGTPIPIIHCPACGPVPVPEDSLPVTLEMVQEEKAPCPECGQEGKREKDTMDTFIDSSWYFLRFLDPRNDREIFRKDIAGSTMPVNLYIGGKEHAVVHLYYARFMNHFLHSLGLVPHPEPFRRLLVQGMVMGKAFCVKESGKYLSESEVEIIDEKHNKAVERATGKPVRMSWEKMSKSKFNGVNPEDVIDELGIDTTRLVILGDAAPFTQRNWSRTTFPGMINWQRRLWMTVHDFCHLREEASAGRIISKSPEFAEEEAKISDARNFYVQGTTFHFRHTHMLSDAIRKMQGLTNSIRRVPQDVMQSSGEFQRALAAQIAMLAPIAPHFASELWVRFAAVAQKDEFVNLTDDVLQQKWPEVDQEYELGLVVKVNGLELATEKFPRKILDRMSKEEATQVALRQPKVIRFIKEKKIFSTEVVFYPGCRVVANMIVERSSGKKKEEAEKKQKVQQEQC
ncbi:leucine--tRNA ligase, mitochondrial [Lutzomyia longipalpis]|uniref:leucine--tRNA ligase, mitochondrial n=1 Tax=Lutzomyia longipalpis TaxID=7200 RepID=UPI0024836FAE|nr:leucine--tRNA ligase, mitochondrial [Lutzomyia longipalpis]